MSVPLKGSRRANMTTTKATNGDKSSKRAVTVAKDRSWDVDELKKALYEKLGDDSDAMDSRSGLKAADDFMNRASTALSNLISGKKGSGSVKEVDTIARACRVALDGYRKWSAHKFDIERRSSSLVSRLIALEAFVSAQNVLDDMRPHLLELYEHSSAKDSVLTLPLPEKELPLELIQLLTSSLVHRIWIHGNEDSFLTSITLEGSIYYWVPFSSDEILKRAFTALSKSKHFSARILGLKCVLNTAELDPDAFWSQACYYASTYAKTITDEREESLICDIVSKSFGELVLLASAKGRFLEGEAFVKFCKYWISFARKLKDVKTIERIFTYLHEAPAQDTALEAAQMCARLLRIQTSLRDPIPELVVEVKQCIDLINQSNNKKVLQNEQVVSEMDKLRKSCIDLFGRNPDNSSEFTKAIAKLVIALVRPERLHSSLDSLYVIAKSMVNLIDSKSWDTSFGYLEQAESLITLPKVLERLSESQLANLHRVTGNAFYNIGGKLYNAERYAGSVTFIKRAAELFEKALGMIDNCKSKEDEGKEEDWTNCKGRLPQVWEALGRCNYKIGHLKDAYESYSTSLRYSLQNNKQIPPLPDDLVLLIERITHIGVMELFLPPEEISLQKTLMQGPARPDPALIAEVLEIQTHVLRSQSNKGNVSEHVKTLIRDCSSLYGNEMPIRRARALLRLLEFAYQQEDEDDMEEIIRDVHQVASLKNLHQDTGLEILQQLYPASADVWITFIKYREQNDSSSSAGYGMFEYISRVSAKLREWKLSTTVPSLTSAKTSPTAAKTPASKKRKKTVTPPSSRKPATVKGRTLALPKETNKSTSVLEAFLTKERESVFALFESCACLAGNMGFIVPQLQILSVLREITGECISDHAEAYARASMLLSLQIQGLGLRRSALEILSSLREVLRSKNIRLAEETELLFHLRYAEILGESDPESSSNSYSQAQKIAALLPGLEKKSLSRKEQIGCRLQSLERAALASIASASTSEAADEPDATLKAILQSLRLWGRAAEILQRAKPQPQFKRSPSPNPFQVNDLKEAINDITGNINALPKFEQPQLPSQWLSFHRGPSTYGSEWRVADGLMSSMFLAAKLYMSRGSFKAAQRYIIDVEALAASLGSPGMHARALVRKAELLLRSGCVEEAYTSITKAAELLTSVSGPDNAEVNRLRGKHHELCERLDDADDMFGEAMVHLQNLEKKISSSCGSLCLPRGSDDDEREVFLGHIVASVLRESVWLYRDDQDEHFKEGLTLLSASCQTAISKGELAMLLGKLGLFNGLSLMHGTLSLSSLTESTISVSTGTPFQDLIVTASTKEVVPLLTQAEDNLKKAIEIIERRGDVPDVRDSFTSLALLRVFQAALGTESDPKFLAKCLDLACSITLRREMREAIDNKLATSKHIDDLDWFASKTVKQSLNVTLTSEIDMDDAHYWSHIRERYTANAASLNHQVGIDKFPENWTVITIATTEDNGSLLVTRQRPNHDPLIFCIPLERHGRKDEGEDQQLSYADAMNEFREIVSKSNNQAQKAKTVAGSQALKSWWAERTALDARLRELLENIEFCWLGAFKVALEEPRNSSRDLVDAFRKKMTLVFSRFLASASKPVLENPLTDALLECFLSLSPKLRDEELEDFIYFILDLYQFHGTPVALADIDIDEIVVELRMALEDFTTKHRDLLSPADDSHLFLVLDKNVQGLPWESIPVLKGKSISRIPCLSFLFDRVELPSFNFTARGVVVNPSRTYYIMNPGGDLKHTQEKFLSWATDMHSMGWKGVVGRPPMELEMSNGLEKSDLFLYFGHGNGEQFISGRKIRNLKRCAATLLWGCSSGAMREMGSFDRIGTPNHYMVAGCPTLVANLWDVTDKDLDKFTESTFAKVGLTHERVSECYKSKGAPTWEQHGVSIAAAVAQSRKSCKMEYLVGASPVVYGIPFYV